MLSNKLIPLKFKTKDDFPSIGNHASLYINEEKGTQSIWNNTTKEYDIVSSINASDIILDTTGFNNNLSSTITTAQHLADKINQMSFSQGSLTYSTTNPIPQAIGGIPSGKTYNNTDITTVLNDLLNPYVAPSITLSSNIISDVIEYGNTISSLDLTLTTTKKSNDIIDVQILRDGVVIENITNPNPNGGNIYFTDNNPMSDTTTYSAIASDGTTTVNSNNLNYTYVNPVFIGNLATVTSTTIPTESDIKGLEGKVIQVKNNISYSFTLTDSRFVIAFPKSWSLFTSIVDQNNMDLIDSFSTNSTTLTINNISVPYYVLIFENIVTIRNYQITFKY